MLPRGRALTLASRKTGPCSPTRLLERWIMHSTKRLWAVLGLTMLVSFAILGWMGREIYLTKPPIPAEVRSASGEVLFTGEQIMTGQQVWQSIGGHQLGSIWGHGSYVAPDWTADWLHREAVFVLDEWARALRNVSYDKLSAEDQGDLAAQLRPRIRENTYNPDDGTIAVEPIRAEAFEANTAYYQQLFSEGSDA